jgi:hypothetical protein
VKTPAKTARKPARKKAARSCFVLVNRRGRWWDGDAWTEDRASARRYLDEPDPDRLARQAAAEAEARTGTPGLVVFVPADQSRRFFARGGRAASGRRAG